MIIQEHLNIISGFFHTFYYGPKDQEQVGEGDWLPQRQSANQLMLVLQLKSSLFTNINYAYSRLEVDLPGVEFDKVK